MFVLCNSILTKIRTKPVFKGHCAIGQERKKGEKKEENNQKTNEETLLSLFHEKFTGN